MIDALVSGRLYGRPTRRTAQNGKAFATAKVRAAMRADETLLVSVIAFQPGAVTALLALEDGDSVGVSGELKVGTYTAKDGTSRPALDLTAHAVVSPYHVQRKRQALKDARRETPLSGGNS